MKYHLIVGNVGVVTRTDDEALANKDYDEWVEISKGEFSRASGCTVVLFSNWEIKRQHQPEEATQE